MPWSSSGLASATTKRSIVASAGLRTLMPAIMAAGLTSWQG
jgi:hypothetical protein